MARKLLVIMVNAAPDRGEQWSAPLQQARVAAAMEFDVELVLSGRAGEAARKGRAQQVAMPGETQSTLLDALQAARLAGVRIKVCTPALELWGDELIEEVEEVVGTAYVISEAMDDDTVVLSY